jgi:photosystem II stability/assembly factor-like uncharacterized protein
MSGLILALIVALFSVNFLSTEATVYYEKVAMDRSGKTIYASNSLGIFVSTDSGASWTQISTCAAPSSIDISSDGQYAMAVFNPSGLCGPVQVTTNFGKTWTKPSFPLRATTLRDGDVSGNGQYMIAVNYASGNGNNEIFVSKDFGTTFIAVDRTDSINLYSTSMSLSADKIYVGQSVGILFVSKDFGTTFSPISTTPYTGYYSGLACDEDCSHLLATSTSGVSRSSDNGVSWNVTSLPRNSAYQISLNGDGHYQFAAGNHQSIYRSEDYGVSWLPADNSPTTNWASLDCND